MPEPQTSPPVGKVLLIVGAFILVVWLICGGIAGYVYWQWKQQNPTGYTVPYSPEVPAPQAPLKPLPDADALAARMKWNQDVYQKVRDEALAGYMQLHPNPAPYDDEARAALRLLAYLSVWDDFYGEGLWQQYDVHAGHLIASGASFGVFRSFKDVYNYKSHYTSDEQGALNLDRQAFDFSTTPYPALFKLMVDKMALHNIFELREDSNNTPPLGKSLDDAPKLADLMTQSYAELVRDHCPGPFLYGEGAGAQEAAGSDEATLKAVSTGLDRAFDAEDKGNPLATALDAEYYVKDAWCARGNGWAKSVTDQGWYDFRERLEKANQICTDLYAAHPDVPATPQVMMTVVLGQQQPRDQMELWFQRGITLNPGSFSLYMAKRWYLLPRWYGSDEDVWNFGVECSTSDDWAHKIPMILIEAIDDAGSRDPGVYARPEIWGPVEKTFRTYLEHFPNAITYRSRFVKCAVAGGHWDVAAEQIKILGNDWDRSIFEGNEYAQVKELVAAHAGSGN